MNHTKYV